MATQEYPQLIANAMGFLLLNNCELSKETKIWKKVPPTITTHSSQNQIVNITKLPKPPNTMIPSSQNQRVNITKIPKPQNTICSSTTVQANANSNNISMLACKECNTLYASKVGLSKHMKNIMASLLQSKVLIDHLLQSHNMNINVKQFHLKSYDLFLSFKIQAELMCNANYVQHCGRNVSTDGSTEK